MSTPELSKETLKLLDMVRSHRWTSDYKEGVQLLEALIARERSRLDRRPPPNKNAPQ